MIVTLTRIINYCHNLVHHLHVWYLSIMLDIFITALAFWMYDHAFIAQKLLLYFKGWVTHITKTKTTQVLDIVIRAGRVAPPPPHQIMMIPPCRELTCLILGDPVTSAVLCQVRYTDKNITQLLQASMLLACCNLSFADFLQLVETTSDKP